MVIFIVNYIITVKFLYLLAFQSYLVIISKNCNIILKFLALKAHLLTMVVLLVDFNLNQTTIVKLNFQFIWVIQINCSFLILKFSNFTICK